MQGGRVMLRPAREQAIMGASVEFAEEHFPNGVFGPRQIKEACGGKVEASNGECLPFLEQTLLGTSRSNHHLVFEPKGLTMREICEMFGYETSTGLPLLFNEKEYKDAPFFVRERLRGGWHLMSQGPISGSCQKKHSEHASIVSDHHSRVFRRITPQAVDVLDFCPSPVQLFWQMVICERVTGKRIMEENGALTRGYTTDGLSVCIGLFRPSGIALARFDRSKCHEFSRVGLCFAHGGEIP